MRSRVRISGLHPRLPLTEAARITLQSRLEPIARILQQLTRRKRVEPKDVHQLRVYCRRASAALQLYRPLLAGQPFRWWRKRLRRWRDAAGQARDFDILHSRLSEIGVEHSLIEQIDQGREAAREPLIEELHRSRNQHRLAEHTTALLNGLKRQSDDEPLFCDWAADQIRAAAAEFASAEPADRGSLAELHRLRISGKRFRYTAELLAPALGVWVQRDVLSRLEQLQTLLGEIQDGLTSCGQLSRMVQDLHNVQELDSLTVHLQHESRQLTRHVQSFWRWWDKQGSKLPALVARQLPQEEA